MASSVLLAVLQEDEISGLSSDVAKKLEDCLKSRNDAITDFQGEIQKLKADYEQKCYELDKKFIESASRLDNESSQNEKSTARCNELETELQDLTRRFETLEKTLHECQQENVTLKRIKDTWDEDRLGLQHVVEKRDLEIERLNDEWKSVSERLSDATTTKNELQLKLDELSSSEVTSQYHVKRVEQEKELLSQQNVQLTEELNDKTNELLAVKKEKGNELVSLRGQFELNLNECKQLKEMVDAMKKNETSMQDKISELHEKSSKTTEDYHSMEELHRSELQSQSRLAELYKASAEDAERKSEELISAVEELQTLVKSNAGQNQILQEQLNESEGKCSEHYAETEKLKKELESANDLITAHKKRELTHEELSEMCPTAAMTSKFIKSGMTLTQIYSQYIEQSDELIVVKEENKRLNEAMDSILEELNAKAPLLKRQREDYERALTTINQLTTQTDEASIQFQQLRQEADDAIRRSAHLSRDNERFRKEAIDLSKQVRFLLKEIEELRGRQILMSPQKHGEKSLLVVNEDGSCNDVSSSSELISQTLVTFKDISELQEQNQKLLGVIRELSEEREKSENDGVDEKTRALQNDLELANEELDRLRDDRSRQTTLVEAIVRQRDMYRVLLAQNPEGGLPPSMLASPSLLSSQSIVNTSTMSIGSPAPATPLRKTLSRTPRTPDVGNAENTRKALVQLQEEYTEYKKEVLENNKILDDKIEDLRNQSSHQKANCAKLEAQLEFSNERFNMNKQNTENAKKEADALRNRNNQLYNIIQQHERSITNLTAELNAANELNSKLQARLDINKSNLDISKRAEDRLTAENASLQREQRNQTILLNNLQKMQESMERQAFEVKSQLNTRVESQEREIKTLRQSSHEVAQSKQDAIQGVEKQLYVVQKQYDAEQLKAVKLSQELDAARRDIESLERDRKDAQAKLASVEERLARIAGGQQVLSGDEALSSGDNESIKLLRQELKEKSTEILNLEARLEKSKRHADHFKDVSMAAEETLKQTNESNKELIESMQLRIEQSSQQLTQLEQNLATIEEENHFLKNEKYKVTGEVEKQTAELRKQLSSVQSDLEASLRRRNDAIKNEQVAIDDLKQQVAKAEEASDNYQREMILHASAMQQLIQLKEKAKIHDGELDKEKNRARSLEESLKEKVEGWKNLEEKHKLENQQQKQRLSDVEEQNKLLHGQIQTMSNKLVDMQSKQATASSPQSMKLFQSRDPVVVATAEAESGDASNQQLLDVIKFLRREKDISDTKCELVQSEIIRTKQQLQQTEKQTNETQQKLKEEQAKVEENVEKLVKMKSLEREVEILQNVKEENKNLREERNQLDADLRSSNARLGEMQENLSPLQAKNREMSAQCVALQSEKKVLSEEAERWKERVQQMTQSPRRQDPEEYRRLIQEKTNLVNKVDALTKEITEQKSETAALKGQNRSLENNLQTSKSSAAKYERDLAAKDEEVKKGLAGIEEKNQTIIRIRRVGRRFKSQYEELLQKQQKIDEEKKLEQKKPSEDAAVQTQKLDETTAALKQAESNLTEERARLQAVSQELSRSQEEIKTLKMQQDESAKKLNEAGQSQSELQGENFALRTQNDENTKNLQELKKQNDEKSEKEKKFSKLLTLAKGQIEKLRRDNQESNKERERVEEEMKKMENEKKLESAQKLQTKTSELQTKIEELQRQLLESRATVHSGSQGKAANIRPTTQKVTPMRLRTARVMPEVQQEAQDTERPGPSSVSQAASSSTQATVAASVAPLTSHATAFVYPMSPARQQQHVVSSGTPILTLPQPVQVQQQEDRTRQSEPTHSAEVTDSDHAIVSSSDDQTVQEEAAAARIAPSSSIVVSSASAVDSEAPSSSAARFIASSSSAASNVSSLNPSSRPFHPGQKRSHEDVEDIAVVAPSRSVAVAGSSREAQVAVAPLPKRQRGSPDQSSESVSMVAPSSVSQQESSTTNEVSRHTRHVMPARQRIIRQIYSRIKRNLPTMITPSPEKSEVSKAEGLIPKSDTAMSVASSKVATDSESDDSDLTESEIMSQAGSLIIISDAESEVKSVTSGARQPDQSQQADVSQMTRQSEIQIDQQQISRPEIEEGSEALDEEGFVSEEVSQSQQEYRDDEHLDASMQQEVATSSMQISSEPAEDVIVLSSDSDGENELDDEVDDGMNDDDGQEDEMVDEETSEDLDSGSIASTTHPEIHPAPQQQNFPTNNLPFLVIPQEPTSRQRFPSRPGPLTPGIVPSSTDDGDGIVPCTPTLVTHRHDESYQAISSPRVPPGGPIRFQFEDVSATQTSLAAVPGGLGSVDNTLMDLAGTSEDCGRSVPSVPSSSSNAAFINSSVDVSFVQSSNSGNAAVSSSIQEEELEAEAEELEQTIPTNVETSTEVREASSIRTNTIRGRRRFRVIGAPRSFRGRGANSPSTSNQP